MGTRLMKSPPWLARRVRAEWSAPSSGCAPRVHLPEPPARVFAEPPFPGPGKRTASKSCGGRLHTGGGTEGRPCNQGVQGAPQTKAAGRKEISVVFSEQSAEVVASDPGVAMGIEEVH